MNFIKFFFEKMPLKDIIIFESSPDFSDNTFWLFKYLAEETNYLYKYKCVWFISNYQSRINELCGIPIICVDSNSRNIIVRIKRFYYTWFSKLIIDCNRYIYKRRNNQKRIYLTHGMPLKIPDSYLKDIGDCDLLPVSGTCFVDFFSQYVKRESVKVYGLPRNDIFKKVEVARDKYIIWMPTFRQHKYVKENSIKKSFPLGIPIFKTVEEVDDLDLFLKANNVKLMIRPHPSQDLSMLKINSEGNIIIADDDYLRGIDESLYSFIAGSSALITDYSSVYYDYILLDRPIGLTFEDVDIYSKQWPLFFSDVKKELPGERLLNIDDLRDFIKCVVTGIDNTQNARNSFIERYGIKETNACKLIVDYMSDILCNN